MIVPEGFWLVSNKERDGGEAVIVQIEVENMKVINDSDGGGPIVNEKRMT